MKQYITKVLKTVAAFLLAFPVLYIVMAATLYNIPLNVCGSILLSPFYYIVSFCALLAGYGLWEMRRWSWYLFVLTQILVCYENAIFVVSYAESHHKFFAFGISVLLQILLSYRVAREIRVPYFFPKIRWWESNPQYRLIIPVQAKRQNGEILEGEILDLSINGCFIKIHMDLKQAERLCLTFKVYGYELSCEGVAVWLAQSTVTHPKGVGIKFNLLSKNQRRTLRLVSRRLRKVAHFYRRSRYLMSQEEFLKQMGDIEGAVFSKSHLRKLKIFKESATSKEQ